VSTDLSNATLVWFLNDHRLSDHPALHAAAKKGPVLPVYVHDPAAEGDWAPGAARRWWIHQSLNALGESLAGVGLTLYIRQGDSETVLRELLARTGIRRLYFNQRPTPALRARDLALARTLRGEGLDAVIHEGPLLHDPSAVTTGSGTPYTVFTPFWRKFQAEVRPSRPLDAPAFTNEHRRADALLRTMLATPATPDSKQPWSSDLKALELLPSIAWDARFYEHWVPTEADAQRRLREFLAGPVRDYKHARDLPAQHATTGLSPYLVSGEISARQIWAAAAEFRAAQRAGSAEDVEGEHFQRELAWRDFSWHVLTAYPRTPDEPLKPAWAAFPWVSDPAALKKWQRGRTGYPLVDAGMRQLWHTGWMHNRVRMVVASFLTKDLLIPWQDGARWFWDTLVDADLANNSMGWQWAAGCGADAQPFFRIFNPTSQGQKFDPDGEYIRHWIPELRQVRGRGIHEPEVGPSLFESATEYPAPMVVHAQARDRAMAALASMKTTA
jgi:deoxyribodipyrimidine photo-lyase